jgi:hypothetical protein
VRGLRWKRSSRTRYSSRPPDPESVADVVTAALRRSDHPDGDVVQWAIDEAVELGYMTREDAGGLRGLTGATKVHRAQGHRRAARPT